jgi:L-fucose mutarotase/ribose pyranase (RbsD/FucU family)
MAKGTRKPIEYTDLQSAWPGKASFWEHRVQIVKEAKELLKERLDKAEEAFYIPRLEAFAKSKKAFANAETEASDFYQDLFRLRGKFPPSGKSKSIGGKLTGTEEEQREQGAIRALKNLNKRAGTPKGLTPGTLRFLSVYRWLSPTITPWDGSKLVASQGFPRDAVISEILRLQGDEGYAQTIVAIDKILEKVPSNIPAEPIVRNDLAKAEAKAPAQSAIPGTEGRARPVKPARPLAAGR